MPANTSANKRSRQPYTVPDVILTLANRRQRHTKCDERRPYCHKCSSTGRECSYGDPFRSLGAVTSSGSSLPGSHTPDMAGESSVIAVQILPLSPNVAANQNRSEGFYFQYFRQVASHVVNTLDRDFMNHIVAASVSPSAVRHAMLALSARHKTFSEPQREGHADSSESIFALRHYGRAVEAINVRLSMQFDDAQALEAMQGCFLLICFELLGGQDLQALIHLEGALCLLEIWMRRKDASSATARNQVSKNICDMYTRLDLLAITYLGTRIPASTTPPFVRRGGSLAAGYGLEAVELALRHLRDELATTEYHVQQIIKGNASGLRYTSQDQASRSATAQRRAAAERMRDTCLNELKMWKSAAEYWRDTTSQNAGRSLAESDPIMVELHVLYCRYYVATVTISTCLDSEESAYDRFKWEFQALVASADAAVQSQDSSSRFSLDTGVIYPLYVTALKCRDSHTRIHAARLLENTGIEGPWNGRMMSRIANEVIRLEDRLTKIEATRTGIHTDIIPEVARAHSVAIEVDRGGQWVDIDCRTKVVSEAGGNSGIATWKSHRSRLHYAM
jgi:hypothetical protein